MPNTLNQVYTQLQTVGVLLTHQFELQFTGTGFDDEFKDITIWAAGANLPGREQKVVDFNYYGYPLKMPGSFDMDHELTLDVRCNKTLQIRRAILNWGKTISSWDLSTGGKKTLSVANCNLYLLDEKMQDRLQHFILYGVYPSKVGDIAMSHDDPKIGTFNCTFTYQYWDEIL